MKYWILLCLSICGVASAQGAREVKPWMGISIDKGSHGVLINAVLPNTPAERVGFKAGDEIFALDGKPVDDPKVLIEMVRSKGVGYSLEVNLRRQGKELKKTLQLELQPDAMEMLDKLYVGKPAPSFELFDYRDDKLLKLEDLRGKPVLIEFWATWCPACRASQGQMNKIAQSFKDLQVISVTDEDAQVVRDFMKGKDFAHPVYLDKNNKVTRDYQIMSIPTFFLIDRSGTVKKVALGGGTYLQALVPEIQALLKAK